MFARTAEWLGTVAPTMTLGDCLAAAADSLRANRTLAAVHCPRCAAAHLDCNALAVRKHQWHTCIACGHTHLLRGPFVQGNPLAPLQPVLRGEEVWLLDPQVT